MAVEEAVLLVVSVLTPLAMLGLIGAYAARYKKVPPNHAMVVYGRRLPGGAGYQVILRGGKFIVPIVESFALISLEPMDVDMFVEDVLANVQAPDGGPRRLEVSVNAIARVSDDPDLLKRSAGTLLNKSGDEIRRIVEATIEGHVRGILAVESAPESNLTTASERVRRAAAVDLASMGIEVRSLFLKVRSGGQAGSKDSHGLDPIHREVHNLDLRVRRIEEKLGLTSSGSRP